MTESTNTVTAFASLAELANATYVHAQRCEASKNTIVAVNEYSHAYRATLRCIKNAWPEFSAKRVYSYAVEYGVTPNDAVLSLLKTYQSITRTESNGAIVRGMFRGSKWDIIAVAGQNSVVLIDTEDNNHVWTFSVNDEGHARAAIMEFFLSGRLNRYLANAIIEAISATALSDEL